MTECAVRQGSRRVVIRRALVVGEPVSVAEEEAAARPAEGVLVRSPLVGVFRARASEKQAAVVVGMTVRGNQVLGAIESMGMLYEVTAEVAGSVSEVLVEDGQPVEYGQELFRVVPNPDDAW
ncbi:MAG: biotin/lipoyl-binding protein [Armatimonadetes bacterium]|nr:biotin/lipoyl-binding protein [Armatimonadota bacterium]